MFSHRKISQSHGTLRRLSFGYAKSNDETGTMKLLKPEMQYNRLCFQLLSTQYLVSVGQSVSSVAENVGLEYIVRVDCGDGRYRQFLAPGEAHRSAGRPQPATRNPELTRHRRTREQWVPRHQQQ